MARDVPEVGSRRQSGRLKVGLPQVPEGGDDDQPRAKGEGVLINAETDRPEHEKGEDRDQHFRG
jgi:hypothetical protein